MKKLVFAIAVFAATCLMTSCGGSNADTPEGIAKKWCELNGKAHSASSDADKEKAREELNKFENEIEEKHKGDEAFMNKVEEEVEKCEDASEGR